MLSICGRRCVQLGTQPDSAVPGYRVYGGRHCGGPIHENLAATLPENLTEVREIYLNRLPVAAWEKETPHGKNQSDEREYQALRGLVLGEHVDWQVVFRMFQEKEISIDQLLMGRTPGDCQGSLRAAIQQYCIFRFSVDAAFHLSASGFALQFTRQRRTCTTVWATGYSGIVGVAKSLYGSKLLISELRYPQPESGRRRSSRPAGCRSLQGFLD